MLKSLPNDELEIVVGGVCEKITWRPARAVCEAAEAVGVLDTIGKAVDAVTPSRQEAIDQSNENQWARGEHIRRHMNDGGEAYGTSTTPDRNRNGYE